MGKRNIPRAAFDDLADTCERLSKSSGEPAGEILKRYLGLMKKYEDYFFSEPWPEEYNFDKATSFTDEDIAFLSANEEEFADRLETILIRKNIFLNGFMNVFGMMWTEHAYQEQFVRPKLKPVSDAFLKYAEGSDDAQEVLEKLKNEFKDAAFVHDGLIDYIETNYLDKQKDKLLTRILEDIHKQEELPECNQYRCRLQREKH